MFAALSLSACGNKQSVVTSAESEGIYLDLDSLKYQVQVSRELNPSDREDRAYMAGLTPADRALAPDEVWFGVFLQVQNDTGQSHPSAQQFKIEDTERNVYRPVPLASINSFAYRPTTLDPKGLIPLPDTPAYDGPTQGAVVLFKLKEPSFDNRPLVLSIESAVTPGQFAHVDLDV
ncbi:MAG: hypothetical protein QOI98_1133 [Solirubrobacteraceae bacterium]|nr:hypothetical protein [Solirubrobacteraceae bacterium]